MGVRSNISLSGASWHGLGSLIPRMTLMMAGKQQRRRTEQQCQSGTPQLLCAPMKSSNKALALEWTLACTGLKLCPPFSTRSTERTIGTLDTAVNRSRRSTIHSDKRALCAGEVTWKRTDKTPFMNPPGKRHPRSVLPWKLRFQMIIVEPKGRPNPRPFKRIWIRYHQG